MIINHSPGVEDLLSKRQNDSAKRIFDEISEILSGNGDVSRATRDRLMLAGMRELFLLVQPIADHDRRLDELERKSIVSWIKAHPKTAIAIVVAAFVLLNLWFVSDFRQAVLPLLGFSGSLFP